MIRFLRGRDSERGQAVILVGLFMTAMLMAVGLAIDAGQLYVARRTMQEAADAAAYAGAVVIYQGGSQAQASAAAVADATRNQYTHGGDDGLTSVVVNTPPTSGSYSCVSDPTNCNKYVEVIISTSVRTALLPAQSSLNLVSVRAVAGAEPLNNGYAIMALDRGNTANALSVSSQGSIDISGAGILVNSTSSSSASNSGTVTVDAPYGTVTSGQLAGTWPNPSTGQNQQADPFAGYPKPSTSGMQVCSTLTTLPCGSQAGSVITINPGVYTVSLSAAGGTTIALNTGIYILKAGINGSGNADIITNAGGAFIFNTVMDYPLTTGGCSGVALSGNFDSILAPMATGTYAGLLFYQDPACTAEFSISGNGELTASGTIYLPTANFVLNGANATLTGSQLVAKTVNVQNGDIVINFSSGTTAQPVLPRLAE